MGFHEQPRTARGPSAFPEVEPGADVQGSVLGAAFRQENLVGAFLNAPVSGALKGDREYELTFGAPPDTSFNPFDVIEGTPYEEYAHILGSTRSQPELRGMMDAIDREQRDRQIIANAGGRGIAASILAGFADVTTALPGLAPLKGAGIARNAVRVGSSAAGEALAVESALQSLQSERTGAESAAAVGGSFILGSALGAGVSKAINRADGGAEVFRRSSAALEGREVEAGTDLDTGLRQAEAESLSAAKVDGALPEDFELPTASAQKVIDLTPRGLSFGLSFAKAKSPAGQKLGAELIESALAFKGVDRLGLEPAVETAVKLSEDRARVSIAKAFSAGYADYRKAHGVSRAQAALKRTDFTAARFAEEVAFSLRRGDVHENPQVQKVAQTMRREVIEPLKERAIKQGLLPEDVKVETAASYFTRMWDSEEIVRRSPEFKGRIARHFAGDMSAARSRGVDGYDLTDVEIDGYAREAAEDVYNTLTSQARIPESLNLTVKARGPMKERTLNVKDADFEDFLNNDAEYVLSRYARVMSADIELKERFGDTTLEGRIKEISDEYNALIDKATEPKTRSALKAERERLIGRTEAARDLIRGTYRIGDKAGIPYRVIQSAMTYNFIRALGGLVLSALPDVYRFAMVHGFKHMYGSALKPLMGSLKQYRVSAAQGRELAGIAETQLNNRLMALADITDPHSARTPVENALQSMGGWASALSGGTLWNDFLKGMATQVTTGRLRNLTNSKADRAFTDRLKLNQRDVQSIRDAMDKHGIEIEGVFDPRADKWPERTREIYARALRADADTVIVTPGIGDKVPGAEHNYWLKPALQFKSFAFAAHTRTMAAGLQEDQARFLISAANMAAMGMFVYYLKAVGGGREPSDNPGTWIAEGLDRSGMYPLVFEVNNMAESMNLPGVYNILSMGEDEASRYAVRNSAGRVLGPTFGLINDVMSTGYLASSQVNPFSSEDAKTVQNADISAARRLLPFGRHPGVQQYLDMYLVPSLKQ